MKNGTTTVRESLAVPPDGHTLTATYTIYRGDQIVANGIAIFEKTETAWLRVFSEAEKHRVLDLSIQYA